MTARGAGASTNIERVIGPPSAANSVSPKSSTATCPPGRRVLGGGGYVTGGGTVMLVGLVPAHGDVVDTFKVTGLERTGGTDVIWSVQSYAICGDELDGLQIVSSSNNLPTGAPTKRVETPCPSGTQPIGSGGSIDGGQGKISFKLISPANLPAPGIPHVTVDGTEDKLDGQPAPPFFGVTAYAICAEPPPGFVQSQHFGPEHSGDAKHYSNVQCPAPTRVHGLGVYNNDPDGHAYLTHLVPEQTLTSGTAVTDPPSPPPPGHMRSIATFAMCAN